MKKALKGAVELESLDGRLEELERKLDRLRALYESFFTGVERIPPNSLRRDVNRQVLEMQQVPIGNTTIRFRFQSLVQRWVLMIAYWNRTMREIEMGTYQRDLARAHRHLASKGTVLSESDALAIGIPANRVKAFVGRQQKVASTRADVAAKADSPARPPAAQPDVGEGVKPTRPASDPAAVPAGGTTARGPIPGLAAGDLEAFYTRFVDAHMQTLGAPPKATLAQMDARLRQELPKVVAGAGDRVVLDVVVEDGRVKLKVRRGS